MSFPPGLWPCSIEKADAAPIVEHSRTLREIVEEAVANPIIVAAAHSPPLTLPAAPPLTLPGLRERFLAGEFRGSSRLNEFNGVARQAHRSETIDSLHLERPREVELAPSFAFASTLHLLADKANEADEANEVDECKRAKGAKAAKVSEVVEQVKQGKS